MNILIIDDDTAILSTMKTFLQGHGHAVKTARAVLPAFALLRRGDTDVVLMDIGLPGLDGINFTRRIKAYPEFSSIPILAITGDHTESAARDAVRAGCLDCFQKPVNTSLLLETLRRLEEAGQMTESGARGNEVRR